MHICEHTSLLHIKIIIASVAYFLFLYTTKLTYAPIQFTKLTPYITCFSKYIQTHNATQVCKLHCSIQIPMEHQKKNLEPNSLTTHIWCSGKQMHSPQTGTLCTKQYNLVAWNIQKINKKQINHSSTEQNFTIHQATIKAKTEQDCIEFLRFCFFIIFF